MRALLDEVKDILAKGFDPLFENAETDFIAEIKEKKDHVAEIQQAEFEVKIAESPQNTSEVTGIQTAAKDQTELQGWTLKEGIEQYRKYCKGRNYSERTITTYDTYINNFTDWLVDAELLDSPCSRFDEFKAKEFLDEYFDEEGWSPWTYNNHLDFLLTLFNCVLKLEKEENKRSIKPNFLAINLAGLLIFLLIWRHEFFAVHICCHCGFCRVLFLFGK